MILLLSSDVGGTAAKLIDQAGKYGGVIWVLSLVLLMIGAIVGVILWKIAIPNAKTFRSGYEKLVDIQKASAPVLTEVHTFSRAAAENSRHLLNLADLAVSALKKINDNNEDLDIAEEIYKIQGALHRLTEKEKEK